METLIYENLDAKKVKCGICSHFCVIRDGRRGICGVRENRGGKLESLVYSNLIASSIDPIEKKPIFHLKPGTTSYSIATVGCNFRCAFCQNANIAQMPQDSRGMIQGRHFSPEAVVDEAVQEGCASIAYTYTEPAVFFEMALDTARLAKKQGLYNIFVTNGYMSEKALDRIEPYLDAANVDLKAFDDAFYRTYCKAGLEPVMETIKRMVEKKILVELTTLLIPGLNDGRADLEAMAAFIADDLGPETPWHISRFHPTYRMTDRPPTPLASLHQAHEIGKKAGLRHVYIGNVPGASEDTCCHSCGASLIERHGYRIVNRLARDGKCPACGTGLYGIF